MKGRGIEGLVVLTIGRFSRKFWREERGAGERRVVRVNINMKVGEEQASSLASDIIEMFLSYKSLGVIFIPESVSPIIIRKNNSKR